MFQMEKNVARVNAGGGNPFVDPNRYKAFVNAAEASYLAQLKRERKGKGFQ